MNEAKDKSIPSNPYGPDMAIVDAVIYHSAVVLAKKEKGLAAEGLVEQWRRVKDYLKKNLEGMKADETPLFVMYSTVAMAVMLLKAEDAESQAAALASAWEMFTKSIALLFMKQSEN